MKEDAIFQFVGFETAIKSEDFIEKWESFAKRFFKQDIHTITLQQQIGAGNKFKYVSRNEWPQDNFCFKFMEGRESVYFPDHQVKVVEAGGYSPVHVEWENNPADDEMSILVFVNNGTIHPRSYSKLPYSHLNIYQAYYQSCIYDHILEFFVNKENAPEITDHLSKNSHHPELGVYKECLVLQG